MCAMAGNVCPLQTLYSLERDAVRRLWTQFVRTSPLRLRAQSSSAASSAACAANCNYVVRPRTCSDHVCACVCMRPANISEDIDDDDNVERHKVARFSDAPSQFIGIVCACSSLHIFNSLFGVVHSTDISDIPEDIKHLVGLQIAKFSSNPIPRLPLGFSQLKSLTVLWMNDMSLTSLPEDFGR